MLLSTNLARNRPKEPPRAALRLRLEVVAVLITNLAKNRPTDHTEQYFGSVSKTMTSLFIVAARKR